VVVSVFSGAGVASVFAGEGVGTGTASGITTDSGVFGDWAKTIDVEVGSRMPKEISSEFQKSFMRRCLGGVLSYGAI
jgi:hypothetical protein